MGVSALVAVIALALAGAGAASASTGSSGVTPNPANELDCNGWSRAYQSVKPGMRALCADPIAIRNGKATRLVDNGWYVGHDEPSIKFISNQPGSANRMTYYMRLPVDPSRQPTVSGSVTDYAELSPAPWFGLPICDPHSYPQNSCTADSDSNSGVISDPNAAGSAFLELQLYPPGYTPFIDSPSCTQSKWCAALTIDSLECTFGFATCNLNCEEPTNFAFLQTNGVPTGPPSPQLTDTDTFFPNAKTLYMNGGDVLEVSLSDPPQGLTAVIKDLTTGKTGYMVASASNGFMNTNIADCSGNPFTFHAEYNTAQQPNQVPWAALEGGVLMEQEIGHFEPCDSLANQDGFSESYPNGESFVDTDVFQTCVGGSEGPGNVGEGPCSPTSTGLGCTNPTTEGLNGPQACPTNDPLSAALCEFSDGNCQPKGSRPVMINGSPGEETWPIAGCQDNQFQNGDLDFDGTDYQSISWPNGTPNHPTPASYIGPFTGGRAYPTIQFETDVAGSEFLCDPATGTDCVAPPLGANFYPYWTLGNSKRAQVFPGPKGQCVWNIGKTIPGLTSQDFGRTAEYGTSNVARYGGTVISSPMPNPEFSGRCGGKSY